MLPVRWRAAARANDVLRWKPVSCQRTSMLRALHTNFRPRTPSSRARVQLSLSRVPQPLPRQYASFRWKHTSHPLSQLSNSLPPQQLQSRFPTKTVIALLIIGGIFYFAPVGIEFKSSLVDRLYHVFNEDPTAMPWHLYRSPEEVDHMIEHHMFDLTDPGFRDPRFSELVSEEFSVMASGWEIQEDEARASGIPITHGCRYRSNFPCEDYFSVGAAPGPGSERWSFWGVYDGHAGRHTSQWLQWSLIPHISRSLSGLQSSSSSQVIANTVMQTFVRLDNDMMARAKHAANWFPAASSSAITALTPAFSGSCALLTMYNPDSQKLHIACVGDSRAVLGRWDPISNSYICKPLSEDQTGFNQAEVDRITKEHPEEEGILDPKSGRLLGIAVTRAFGDHRWKWDNDFIKQLQCKFWGPAPRPNAKTQPYMTAEPVVTEVDITSIDPNSADKIRNERSDFMILASDGLWDKISSENAVLLVEQWIAARDRAHSTGLRISDERLNYSVPPNQFNIDPGVSYSVEEGKAVEWKATPEYFTVEDDNAAICLARNALGGTRKGVFAGVLTLPEGLMRNVVDDMTIMVVFFDKLGERKEKEVSETKRRWWMPFDIKIITEEGGR